jgi:4-diphosphocytidyl-2-C-methyl-D-erythritol kinase
LARPLQLHDGKHTAMIGTGLPAPDNTHEVAQAIAPDSSIVYVGDVPLVLVRARSTYRAAHLRRPVTPARGHVRRGCPHPRTAEVTVIQPSRDEVIVTVPDGPLMGNSARTPTRVGPRGSLAPRIPKAGNARPGGYHRGIVSPLTTVTVRAPAKVNLQLAVGPVRPDGYHDVVTVYHAVSLFDEVTVAPAERDGVAVYGEGADSVPADGGNLASRAAGALLRASGPGARDAAGLAIRITKRIPVAAGLAGGSADAAAALVACNELWRTGLSQQELCELASGIGSDVAFGLLGGTAIGMGRGERVIPALVSGMFHWVLAFATGGLSTADVYAACDRIRASQESPQGQAGRRDPAAVPDQVLDNALMAALRSGDPTELGPLLSNDLQVAAVSLRPELRRTLAAGRELGALGAMVSGSGPTCAFLAKNRRHARDLAAALAGAGVCRTVAQVTGPAPGATIVATPAEQA